MLIGALVHKWNDDYSHRLYLEQISSIEREDPFDVSLGNSIVVFCGEGEGMHESKGRLWE